MARRKWNYETIKQVVDGENPFIQVGYVPKTKERVAGEIWTDSRGITWEQKSGYKSRVNKQVDSIREQLKQICSKCKKDIQWGTSYDKLFYAKTGKCHDCTVSDETLLRIKGKYDTYETYKILSNKLSVAREFKEKTTEAVNYLKTYSGKIEFINSDGTIESWTDELRSRHLSDAISDLERVDKLIAELEGELKKIDFSEITSLLETNTHQ
jgi:hypothetical protein